MKLLISFFSILLFLPFSSFSTEIHEHHCVESGIEKVYQLLSGYDEYANMKGSKYSVSLAGAEVDLIQMIKSQTRKLKLANSQSEDLVWIVLQPALINDAKLYPRFLLDCKMNWIDANSFDQNCKEDNYIIQ